MVGEKIKKIVLAITNIPRLWGKKKTSFCFSLQDSSESGSNYHERVVHPRRLSPLDATVGPETPNQPYRRSHPTQKTPWEIYHDINSHA